MVTRNSKERVKLRKKKASVHSSTNAIPEPRKAAESKSKVHPDKSPSKSKPKGQTGRREIIRDGQIVLYEGIRYRWNTDSWYCHDSNTKVPKNTSLRIETKFLPETKIPKGKIHYIKSEDMDRGHFFVQGGLPGLGKKR